MTKENRIKRMARNNQANISASQREIGIEIRKQEHQTMPYVSLQAILTSAHILMFSEATCKGSISGADFCSLDPVVGVNSLDHVSSMTVTVCNVHPPGKLHDGVVRRRLALIQHVGLARERADKLGAVVVLARRVLLLGAGLAERVHCHRLATRRTAPGRGGTDIVPALAAPPAAAAALAVAAAAAAGPYGQPVADPADKVHKEEEEGEEQEEAQESNDGQAKGDAAAAGELIGPVVHDCEEALSDAGVMNGVGHV